MSLLAFVVVLALLGQTEAVKLTKEDYAAAIDSYLANNHEDQRGFLQTLGPDFNAVDDQVYTYHKSLIDLYKTSKFEEFCINGGPRVAHQVLEFMSFTTPEKTPLLSKITKSLLEDYANLCRKKWLDMLVSKADKFNKDLQPYVDQMLSLAEQKVKEKEPQATYGPFSIDKFLSKNELASVAYSIIISHQDEETMKITDPKRSVSEKLVSSVYMRYVKIPCDRYVRSLDIPQDYLMAWNDIDTILGRDTSDQATKYNLAASAYAICSHFTNESDPLEGELARVIAAQTGKKVKPGNGGLLSSCFPGSSH